MGCFVYYFLISNNPLCSCRAGKENTSMFGLYNFYVFIDLSAYDLLLCWYDTSSGGEAWHRRRRQTIEARLV